MNEYKTRCPHCGSELAFECEGTETTTICQHCGQLIHIMIVDKQPYAIEEALFQKGESLPVEKKKDYWIAARNRSIMARNNFSRKPAWLKVAVFILLVLAIIGPIAYSIATRPQKIQETMAFADRDSLWSEFRAYNPYNFQTVGIRQYDDNSYNILLSEPNNNVTEEALKSFFKKYNCDLKTFKCKMGYDGWLKDAVVSFNDIKCKDLPKMSSKLFELLYGTDYKAAFLDLDTIPEHIAFSGQNLNYQISEDEIRTWFIDQNEPLFNIEDPSKETTVMEALNATTNESQLYYSKEAGFVVWVLKRSSQLNASDFTKKARMFALDSDLIFGAISNNQRTAVIARERSIPVYELPPMRQEMLAVLAATRKDELSQSYERNNLFAGKLKGGKDYAPILLSDELWHTEYGNILNITDQMLKSWSENGDIEYEGFLHYPKPIDWAFNIGAYRDLDVSELTYNWNTAGAGYIVDGEDGLSIYAVNRTGSLPISYIPGDTDETSEDDPVFQAEENAYDFYSNLSNPELVKVVQYASMYQIFNNFNIHIPQDRLSFSNSVTTNDLDLKVEEVLNSLCSLRDDKKQEAKIRAYFEEQSQLDKETERDLRRQLADKFDKEYKKYKDLWPLLSDKSYNSDKQEYIDSYIQDIKNALGDDVDEFLKKMDTLNDYIYENRNATANGKPFLRSVGHYIINPRAINFDAIISNDNLSDDQYCQYTALLINQHTKDLKLYNSIMKVATLEDTKEIYLKENKGKSLLWQKCPTIVESWSMTDSVYSVGGHNLSSKTTPIKINNKLNPGQYNVTIDAKTGRKVIEVCAKDQGRVTSSVLRKVERTKVQGIQDFSKTNRVTRARSEIMAEARVRTERGYNPTEHGHVIEKIENGYVINGKIVHTTDAAIEEFARCCEAGGDPPFETMKFKYFSENEQIAFIDGVQTRLTRSREFSSIPRRSFEVSKVEFTDLGDGYTIAKVPINAQDVRITTAGMGGNYSKTSSLWGRIKTAWFEFKVPTNKLQQFKAFLEEFFKNPTGVWNRFQFQRKLKMEGFEQVEIIETYEFHISVAKLFNHQHPEYYVFIEKNIA